MLMNESYDLLVYCPWLDKSESRSTEKLSHLSGGIQPWSTELGNQSLPSRQAPLHWTLKVVSVSETMKVSNFVSEYWHIGFQVSQQWIMTDTFEAEVPEAQNWTHLQLLLRAMKAVVICSEFLQQNTRGGRFTKRKPSVASLVVQWGLLFAPKIVAMLVNFPSQ